MWRTNSNERYPGHSSSTVDQNAAVFKLFFDELVDRIKVLCNIFGFDVVKRINKMLDLCVRLVLDMIHACGSCYHFVSQ